MSRGVDVSAYQGPVDFDALKADADFIIAKATEGTGFIDPQFRRNWFEPTQVGLRRGAYHFARPDLGLDAQDEAAHFLTQIGGWTPDDLLALDYEVDYTGDVVGWCIRWLDAVRALTGITPYIYLNRSLVQGFDWSSVIAAGYPLWLAYYDGQPDIMPQTPWPKVAIKQWTSTGRIAGILGDVDLNSMEDDMAETPEQTYARIAPLLQEKIVAPQENTNTALKQALAALSQNASGGMSDAELAVLLTKLGVVLERAGADIATPKP